MRTHLITTAIGGVLLTGAAHAQNLATNPTFDDTTIDGVYGDDWGSFGAVGFDNWNPDGTPGHGILYGDNLANTGYIFQTGIAGTPGTAYEFSVSVSLESSWDADAAIAVEFYEGDDSTLIDTAALAIDKTDAGTGYHRYTVQGTAPAGTVYVRPVIGFANVLSTGAQHAATVDNAVLTVADDNMLYNPGMQDILADGGFGDLWGVYGAAGFDDFFPGPDPGHAVLYGDTVGNSGGFYQQGIRATPGAEYRFKIDASFEIFWEADTYIGLEFYDADDATLLDSRVVELNEVIDVGYYPVSVTAVAPAGAVYVRPIVMYDNVLFNGSLQAATFDGAELNELRPNQNHAFNGGFLDLNGDTNYGDGWGTWGAAGLYNWFGASGPGHAALFGDNIGNTGGMFQLGISGRPGATYDMICYAQTETNWDAELRCGMEFYAADDATKIGEAIQTITPAPGTGYHRYTVSAEMPVGAVFVRPVASFDNVLSSGVSRASTVDDVAVVLADDNMAVNPGFEEWFGTGYGSTWGTWGAADFQDFYNSGDPGHATFYADVVGNLGGVYQQGIPGVEGTTYELTIDASLEASFDAFAQFGLEFYEGDDATMIASGFEPIAVTPGAGYQTISMTATAPTGTAYVRPVFKFDNALTAGADRAATIDNVRLAEATSLACSPFDLTTIGAGSGDPGYGVPDGAITAADIQYYVNAYVAGDPGIADMTTTGAGIGDPGYGVPDGNITAADIQYYVNGYVAGCP